ncbi:MAG: hypothetical protein JRL30_00990 [Deltaproteobacteria bacterium]|nr:hypothetical protein [Deltaproteobacteria bacterium]
MTNPKVATIHRNGTCRFCGGKTTLVTTKTASILTCSVCHRGSGEVRPDPDREPRRVMLK